MTQVAPGQDAFYQPPPPAMYPPPNQPVAGPPQTVCMAPGVTTTVVVTQPHHPAAAPGQMAPYTQVPAFIVCQYCGATVNTSVHTAVGLYTFLISLVLICVGLVLGCCLIPFFVDSCKDSIHTCPNCQRTVGKYARM